MGALDIVAIGLGTLLGTFLAYWLIRPPKKTLERPPASPPPGDYSWEAFMKDVESTMPIGELLEKWRDHMPKRPVVVTPPPIPTLPVVWIPTPFVYPGSGGTTSDPGYLPPTTTGGDSYTITWTYGIGSSTSSGSNVCYFGGSHA